MFCRGTRKVGDYHSLHRRPENPRKKNSTRLEGGLHIHLSPKARQREYKTGIKTGIKAPETLPSTKHFHGNTKQRLDRTSHIHLSRKARQREYKTGIKTGIKAPETYLLQKHFHGNTKQRRNTLLITIQRLSMQENRGTLSLERIGEQRRRIEEKGKARKAAGEKASIEIAKENSL
jgi:hypothetical protein